MTFNSFSFWLVFLLIFGIYWLIPAKWNQWRKVFLIVVSYLLYMNWKPTFALVLLAITLVTYGGGYVFDKQAVNSEKLKDKSSRRKRLIWLFAVLSLLPLLVFKYYNFVNESVFSLLDGRCCQAWGFAMSCMG